MSNYIQKRWRSSNKMGSIRSIIIKKALEPFLKALIDDTVKGILRSIGDAGEAPWNTTGRTLLRWHWDLNEGILNITRRRSAFPVKVTVTTTPLGANASYIQTWQDHEYFLHAHLMYLCYSDVDGTMYSEWSHNAVDVIREDSLSYVGISKTGNLIDTRLLARYSRVRYVNGATAQTTFVLTSSRSD